MRDEVFLGPDRRMQQSPCPQCGHRLDGITPAALNRLPAPFPDEGDFSVCMYCGSVLRFESNGKLHKATPDDLAELINNDPKAFTLIQTVTVAAKMASDDRRRNKFRSN
jgi:hypothetical protein